MLYSIKFFLSTICGISDEYEYWITYGYFNISVADIQRLILQGIFLFDITVVQPAYPVITRGALTCSDIY
jgi:hypothetical protein